MIKCMQKQLINMQGGMSNRPLLISQIIDHAAQYHGEVEIVTRTVRNILDMLNISCGHWYMWPNILENYKINIPYFKHYY